MGFITGIVILLVEKDDKFIRFHAVQSTVIFGVLFVVNVIIGILFGGIIIIGVVTMLVNTLITIVAVVVWIVSMIKAYQGEMFKWPIAGDFSEKQVK